MASFNEILSEISRAIEKFNRRIPQTQRDVLATIQEDLRGLDLNNGKIKATVKNLSLIARIKNRMTKTILTDDYLGDVKEFAGSFNEVTKLHHDYWQQVESQFKPRPLLREIKNMAIEDVVTKLTEAGIGANIGDKVTDILRQNITGGGSYRSLSDQLREFLTTTETPGGLERYAKQITTDGLNQYSAQVSQVVSSDLGFEWFKYDNTDIDTTRPFCDAMTDRKFFHVSEVPALLRAEGLTYVNKKGERVAVPIYDKTGLPHGLIPGTDPSNFFVRRGGYNCGHQIRPVSEGLVDPEIVKKIKAGPVEAKPGTPAGKSVSSQIKKIQPSLRHHADSVLAAIDKVHGTGANELREIKVNHPGELENGAQGHFVTSYDTTIHTAFSDYISVSKGAKNPEFTLVHEIGHYLDFDAIGRKGFFDSKVTWGSHLKPVLEQAKKSKTITQLSEILARGTAKTLLGEVPLNEDLVKFINYVRSPHEIWARAYAQYVTRKSGNAQLQNDLQARMNNETETGIPQHWDEEDFKLIEIEIDKLFTKLGWLH